MTEMKTKSPSLYTLGETLLSLAEAVEVDTETGEVTGLTELESANGAFEDKAAAVAVAIRGARAYAEALKQYKKDIADRQAAAEAKIERLEDYLAGQMEKVGKSRIDTVEARITLRQSEAVEVYDEDIIPQEYKKIKWEISKTAIKNAIKDGRKVAGAGIETRTNVVIK